MSNKLVFALVISVCAVVSAIGIYGSISNRTLIDTEYKFNKARIYVPGDDDPLYIDVTSWKDWEDSDMVQIISGDTVYYTHGTNVLLIKE